jgi:two-component system, NtrC family, sensor kinase
MTYLRSQRPHSKSVEVNGSVRGNYLDPDKAFPSQPETDQVLILKNQLQQQARRAALLNLINSEIRSASNLNQVLDAACCILGKALACSRVLILVAEPEDAEMFSLQGEFQQGQASTRKGLKVNVSHNLYLQRLVHQSAALATHWEKDTTAHEPAWLQASNIQSSLAFAMDYQGRVNGIIALQQHDVTREWLAWERELLEDVGNQLAIAINQTQLHIEARRQAEREALLRLIISQIRSTLDSDTILQTAVREVRQLLKTDRVVVYQFLDQHWQGEVVVEDVQEPWISVMGEAVQDNCFSEKYAHQYLGGRVRAIHNILEAGLDECHVRFLQSLQVKANLIVPIVTSNKLWGLLLAQECNAPRNWQPWEMELLKQLADQVAIAIQQAELYDQIRQAATQSQAQAQQLRNALEDLQETQAQLIQSEKLSSLGQMVAGIAHEINNATSFIHANLPYAQQYATTLDTAIQAYETACPEAPATIARLEAEQDLSYIRQDFPKLLRSMQEGTKRIREIVNTLRNFSRLDEVAHKWVDLHEGLDSTLVILQHRFKHGAVLNKHYGNLPTVKCNPGQLNQVFLNLLNNALDAAGNQAEVTIRTWQSAPDWVTIAIRDNGSGIPPEIQSRIFDPFFTTKEVGKGTGLGLSISYQIVVQGHGGRIYCLSEPEQGTEFRVELPLASCPTT